MAERTNSLSSEDIAAPIQPAGRPSADLAALRHRIAEAAYDVFLSNGFAGATTGLIAARAKMSKRALYLAFENKDQMFAAVVLAKRHLILDPPPANTGPAAFIDRLALAFRLNITAEDDREREALIDLINREATLSQPLMEYLYDRGIIRTREILVDWLEAERAHGYVAFNDVQVVASLLMDVVFGALAPRRRKGGPISREARKAHIVKCLRVVLAGLAAEAAPPPGPAAAT